VKIERCVPGFMQRKQNRSEHCFPNCFMRTFERAKLEMAGVFCVTVLL